ncbi:hypothetical protein QE152_g39783 [Popillia japonica]|uniref:Uncharacterized protein n=1 Tax=Popillia japonica TaxID=7064 RepID=A0AAW1HTR7_POPJA
MSRRDLSVVQKVELWHKIKGHVNTSNRSLSEISKIAKTTIATIRANEREEISIVSASVECNKNVNEKEKMPKLTKRSANVNSQSLSETPVEIGEDINDDIVMKETGIQNDEIKAPLREAKNFDFDSAGEIEYLPVSLPEARNSIEKLG